MSRVTRRVFLMSAAALAGCRSMGKSGAGPQGPAPSIRQPKVGQSWQYAKHDVFTSSLVENQIDTISTVGNTIEIESRSEAKPAAPKPKPSWGSAWLKDVVPHHDNAGPLPSEVQDPWGSILVDPHWSEVQVYEHPVPLWPSELRPGWSKLINTRYKTSSDRSGLQWSLKMSAERWESIDVPAGRFTALRFSNLINFQSTEMSRRACQRQEAIWFVPEIGRWAARQSTGTYIRAESIDDSPISEAGFRWELLSYT